MQTASISALISVFLLFLVQMPATAQTASSKSVLGTVIATGDRADGGAVSVLGLQ